MTISPATHGKWTVLALAGKLDNAGSEALKAALLPLLGTNPVALDFTEVEYVTSAGFRVLMQVEKEQRHRHGRLVLGNMTAPVGGFFEIAGLDTLFKIVPDLKTALAEQA